MRVTCIAGARPNFMKVAPIMAAASACPDLAMSLVHTGQHYDDRMSGLFFEDLRLPRPDVYLSVGSGSHAIQTARIMEAFDAALNASPTDLVLVVGDVNSTIACALVAAKRGIQVAHVEAGLRSGDRSMPEEINRILTDQIADYLFTTEPSANEHLRREGVPAEKIHFVGNVMIDTLLRSRERANRSDILTRLALAPRYYAVCTLHRPSNVDTEAAAACTVRALEALGQRLPVVFPVHPRTRTKLVEFGLASRLLENGRLRLIEPLGYIEFLALLDNAALVFTDSGGIQEETTALGVPCLTFRDNTERPVTVDQGTNRLVGTDPARLGVAVDDALRRSPSVVRMPTLWDGRAAERIVRVLAAAAAPCTQLLVSREA